MNQVYLGLGTNKGARDKNLKQAISLIDNFAQTKVINLSKVYETKPWGYTEQADFLNMCIELKTELGPEQLLQRCQLVEDELGRKRDKRWGPRIIDVDILIYDNLNIEKEDLILPHPRITERAFVLKPLADLNNDLFIASKTVKKWLNEVDDQKIKNYKINIEDY